jgi:hypothetical protein
MSQVVGQFDIGWNLLSSNPSNVVTSTDATDSQANALNANFVADSSAYYGSNENDLINAKNQQQHTTASLFQNQQMASQYYQQPTYMNLAGQNGYNSKSMDQSYLNQQQQKDPMADQGTWGSVNYSGQQQQQDYQGSMPYTQMSQSAQLPIQTNYNSAATAIYDQPMPYQKTLSNQQAPQLFTQQQQKQQEIQATGVKKTRDRPVVQLSVNLIHTYKNINEVLPIH